MQGMSEPCALKEQVHSEWGSDVTVVIAGLSNTYTGYVATPEEYDVQRFEGAATAYGRHTLGAYIQVFFLSVCPGVVPSSKNSAGHRWLGSGVTMWWSS